MIKLYLVDAVDVVENGMSRLKLYCKTMDNQHYDISVAGVPCSIHVGIDEGGYTYETEYRSKLEWILKQPPQCRYPGCEEHNTPLESQFGIPPREPCSSTLDTSDPIFSWELSELLRPFDINRPKADKFLVVKLRNPWDLSRASNFLKKNIPCANLLNKGLYNKMTSANEYFLAETGLSGCEWFEIPAGLKGGLVHMRDIRRLDPQPAIFPHMVTLTLDIETLSERYNDWGTLGAEYPVCVLSAEVDGKMTSFVLNADRPLSGLQVAEQQKEESDPYEDELVSPEILKARRKRLAEIDAKIEANRRAWMCKNAAERTVKMYDSEESLLWEFSEFVRSTAPDFVVGFNHRYFDIPYLIRRAEKLGVEGFDHWSRGKDWSVKVRYFIRVSERNGIKTKTCVVDSPGIVFLDMMLLAQQERECANLSSYSLNSVLGALGIGQKEDVSYEQIWPYFYGSSETRDLLVQYCEGDVHWTYEVGVQFNSYLKLQAKCQIQRILLRDATDRGLTYCLTQFVRSRLIESKYILPVRETVERIAYVQDEDGEDGEDGASKISERVFCLTPAQATINGYSELHDLVVNQGKKYDGAYVLDPVVGVHRDAVIIFDFSGLYTNEAISNNICPSTLISGPLERKPDGQLEYKFHFKPASEQMGILPQAWIYLAGERKKAKNTQKQYPKGSLEYRQYSAFEQEIKLLCNSLYGALGARTSVICALPCSSSITAHGQKDIKRVKAAVEAEFPNIRAIYGDTDSLFLKVEGVRDAPTAYEWVAKLDKFINGGDLLYGTLTMEYEAVLCPSYFTAKKKYVGAKLNPDGTVDDLKIRGLITRSLCPYFIQTINTIYQMFLGENKSLDDTAKYLERRAHRLLTGKARMNDLKMTKRLSKPVSEYTSMGPHLIAAEQLRYIGKGVKPGERVGFIYALLSLSKADEKSRSKHAVEYSIALQCGYKPDLGLYADMFSQSVETACGLLFSGYPVSVNELITRQAKVFYTPRQVPPRGDPPTSSTFWFKPTSSTTSTKRVIQTEDRVTCKKVQMGLFGMETRAVVAETKQTKKKRAKIEDDPTQLKLKF